MCQLFHSFDFACARTHTHAHNPPPSKRRKCGYCLVKEKEVKIPFETLCLPCTGKKISKHTVKDLLLLSCSGARGQGALVSGRRPLPPPEQILAHSGFGDGDVCSRVSAPLRHHSVAPGRGDGTELTPAASLQLSLRRGDGDTCVRRGCGPLSDSYCSWSSNQSPGGEFAFMSVWCDGKQANPGPPDSTGPATRSRRNWNHRWPNSIFQGGVSSCVKERSSLLPRPRPPPLETKHFSTLGSLLQKTCLSFSLHN